MPAWEDKAKARIRASLGRWVRTFQQAQRENRMEADVGNHVLLMLSDVFGYDMFNDVTAEYRVRGQFADYAVKLEGRVKFFVEVKGPNVKLNQAHLLQVTTYAVKEGVEWVALTNGLDWQLYHISKAMPIEEELLFACNLAERNKAETASKLFILAREAMQRDVAKAHWNEKLAVSAPNLLRVLYGAAVLNKMRTELRALTGYRASSDELRKVLEADVVRPDFAERARRPGRPRGRRAKIARRGASDRSNDGAEAPAPPAQE